MRGEFHIADIVCELERDNLLPAIVFRTSRMQCDIDAEHAATNRLLGLPDTTQAELVKQIKAIASSYEMDLELITTHPQYQSLVRTAVGAHHAGQLLMWRLLLEELMSDGMLRVLVATGTVAAGVDFPARSVVITAHSKRGAEGYSELSPSEFQQMSGRAGRRGKDTVGFCIAAPAPFCDARALLRIAKQPPEPLVSAYFPSPSTVLNLLRYRNVDDLRSTVDQCLAAYRDRLDARKLRAEAELEIAKLPAAMRGEFAALAEPQLQAATQLQDNIGHGEANKKRRKRVNRFFRQAAELEQQQHNLLERSLRGLTELGYVEGGGLSPKGYWAANLCTNIVLELAELIESKLLIGANFERLAQIVATISADSHRSYLKSKSTNLRRTDLEVLKEVVERVRNTGMPGVRDACEIVTDAAHTVATWLKADSWAEFRSLLLLNGVAEGDAARLITQTAEHLNQIARLTATHPELALIAETGKSRLLRPPLTEVINLESN